jgi:Flp pilus assembly pilin Flp
MVKVSRRRAQSLAEYALILALIAIAAIAVLIFLSGGINKTLSKAGSAIGG